MRIKIKSKRGQAMILTLVFMTVILGMAAAVVDVGAWYRTHRQMQNNADAAALAGAAVLTGGTGSASATAINFANRNGGGVTAGDISFPATYSPGDTIDVTARKAVPGVFAKLFGLDSVTVRAHARALSMPPGQAKYVAPIGVDIKHPMLQCEPLPCFNQQTTLDLKKTGPGAFRLINIDGSHGGTNSGTLADWMLNGYSDYMPLDWYYSDPGAKFNSSAMQSALTQRIGSVLLFPVYRGVRAQGSNFEYEVVGWVGFHMTGFTAKGSSGTLDGWFTSITWEGIQSDHATGDDFGARTITLIN
jgi:UPF0716 family protein affecting phage T7 exclusion